jgi:DNA-binding NarL/FixJ family response regulator
LKEKKPSAEEEARRARIAAKKEARRMRNEAIIDLHERGFANYEICARLDTSRTTVSVVIQEYKTKKQ